MTRTPDIVRVEINHLRQLLNNATEKNKQYEDALKYMEEHNVRTPLLKVIILAESGREDDAKTAAEEAEKTIAGDPSKIMPLPEPRVWWAELYARSGIRLDTALDLAMKSVGQRPDYKSYRTLGYVQMKRGEYSEAVESLERSVSLHPSMPECWYILGLARAAAGDAKGARKAFSESLEVNPNYGPAKAALENK